MTHICLRKSCNQAARTFNWPRCILFLAPPRPPQLGNSRNACMHSFEMVKRDQPCIMYNTIQYQILYEYLTSSPSLSMCVCLHLFFYRNVETEKQSVSSVQIAQTCLPKGAAAINGQFDEGIKLFEAPWMCRKKPHPMTGPMGRTHWYIYRSMKWLIFFGKM